jgi:DNA/RNA-binding domain of Phe-tRNA-synthetase-like protein
VIFADAAGNAHARRWTNRQSGASAVRRPTRRVLIVAEAQHGGAAADVDALVTALGRELGRHWAVSPPTSVIPGDRQSGYQVSRLGAFGDDGRR